MARLCYYGDCISPNIVKTPEGYLICKNVPIGRTGVMEYAASEIGIKDGDPERLVSVYREAEDLFDARALASFEGKPVTNGHPPEDIAPHNWASYSKGHVQNVRRGAGEDADKMLADLVITDPQLISEVENNLKRGISSGYNVVYSTGEDGAQLRQRQIRGNHVAVVSEGRAGKSVCINDSAPKAAEGKQNTGRRLPAMSKNPIGSILNLFAGGVKDAKSPGDIETLTENAMRAIDSAVTAAGKEDTPITATAEDSGGGELLGAIAKLTAAVEALTGQKEAKLEVKSEAQDNGGDLVGQIAQAVCEALKKTGAADSGEPPAAVAKPEDPIGELLGELTGEGTQDNDLTEQEEALTVNAEAMDGTDNSGLKATSRDTAIAILRSARPAIAQIKDADERKRVTDALLRSVKALGNEGKGAMAGVMSTAAKAAQSKVLDAAAEPGFIDLDARQKAYDERNPHIKKEVK
jgi:hypothetical protein